MVSRPKSLGRSPTNDRGVGLAADELEPDQVALAHGRAHVAGDEGVDIAGDEHDVGFVPAPFAQLAVQIGRQFHSRRRIASGIMQRQLLQPFAVQGRFGFFAIFSGHAPRLCHSRAGI